MFMKIDDGDVEGIFETDGYIDIRTHSDAEITELILQRIRSNGAKH
jgi:hypothetical protein